MNSIPYEYHNLPIPGGGYVTGLLYHPTCKGLLYLRTDIGGTYRFDRERQTWVCLIHQASVEDLSQTFPISLALHSQRPNMLYVACGERQSAGRTGQLSISEDYGEHFIQRSMPMFVHGNLSGRGTGERLLPDGDALYYASQHDGLWITRDEGQSWQRLDTMPETHLTFAGRAGRALIIGTAGVSTQPSDNMRGHSLYVSYDDGASFAKLPVPPNHTIEGCWRSGLSAQRFCADEKYLYVTFSSAGPLSSRIDDNYSCDSGDAADGRIVRYCLQADGTLGPMEDITPAVASPATGTGLEHTHKGQALTFGLSGVSAVNDMLVLSTINKDSGDSVFLSRDNGDHWQQILYDLTDGELRFRTSYMRPEYNGGHSIIHWLSDIKLNPFDPNEAWFNTGTGVFRAFDLTKESRYFTDWSDGIEETVHLNVYSLPKGEVQVIDIVGDLGGFAFTDIDTPCENSFANLNGDRYITCINADFSDEHPEWIVVTPRGNWKGKTKGGLIFSRDQAKTFTRLPMPFGLTSDIDAALSRIEKPNVNSGWVAMSPDGQKLVWSIAYELRLPVRQIVYSHDAGRTFHRCTFFGQNGEAVGRGSIKAFCDRMDSRLFYAFGDHSDFYVSHDGGATFRAYALPDSFPHTDFGLIDCANRTEVRGEAGRSGTFYLALGEGGLWKLHYDAAKDAVSLQRLSRENDAVYRVGLGLCSPDGDYRKDPKALYVNARLDGVYGFYQSLDDVRSFVKLNNDRQMYGEINSIDGDCRVFGRYYLATGSCGLLYGQPQA